MPKSSLGDLLRSVPHKLSGNPGIEICDLSYDSRKIDGPGTLFAAFVGARVDGHCFIDEAVRRGAVAVLVSKPVEVPEGVSVVRVDDTRLALAEIAKAFYGDPSSRLMATYANEAIAMVPEASPSRPSERFTALADATRTSMVKGMYHMPRSIMRPSENGMIISEPILGFE
jgi:hypothetical protein